MWGQKQGMKCPDETAFFKLTKLLLKIANHLVLSIWTSVLPVSPLFVAKSLETDVGSFTSKQFYDHSVSLGFDKTLPHEVMEWHSSWQYFILEFLGDKDTVISETFLDGLRQGTYFLKANSIKENDIEIRILAS